MGSNLTILIYAILLALLGVVYWLVNKRDIFGTRSHRRRGQTSPWSRLNAAKTPYALRLPGEKGDVSDGPTSDSDVVRATQVLEDMYREFSSEIRQLRTDLEVATEDWRRAWQEEQNVWVTRLEAVEKRVFEGEAERVPSVSPGSMQPKATGFGATSSLQATDETATFLTTDSVPVPAHGADTSQSFDARYLEVFDRIQQGQAPASIAKALGIPLSDVERVLEVMTGPPQALQ